MPYTEERTPAYLIFFASGEDEAAETYCEVMITNKTAIAKITPNRDCFLGFII